MWFSKNKKPERLFAYLEVIDWHGDYKKIKAEYSLGFSCWVINTYLEKYLTNEDGTFQDFDHLFVPKKWGYHTPAETKILLQEYLSRNSEVGTMETFVEKNTNSVEVFPEMIEHKGK